MDSNILKIGYNTSWNDHLNNSFAFDAPANHGKGVDFVLCHMPMGGTVEEECRHARDAADYFDAQGIDFIANFEAQNFEADIKSSDGYDWANHPDGTHRLNLPEEYIRSFTHGKSFLGIMYDEFEHALINRNISITLASKFRKILPLFKPSESTDVIEQGELCAKQFREYADYIKSSGAPSFAGEHVFPVLYHTFARAGITPNFKSQKESSSNIQFAIAAGAALEYGTELWNCVDLWFNMTFPGHSVNEMYHNLIFAYLAGVNRVYVEHANAMVSRDEKGNPYYNEYGKQFSRFTEEYRGKARSYTFKDYKPEIGIIRYDDTYWGQGDPVAWRYMLFGNKKIKPDHRAKEWIKAFNLITHGELGNKALTWHRVCLRSLRKHRSFATMNGAAVFDDRVAKDKLTSLKLCFLCGYHISPETLKAVDELVKDNGLTAVTSRRFLPKELANKVKGGVCEIPHGKGCYIVTENFAKKKLRKRLTPLLGKKDEITMRFKDNLIRLKISKDGESFTQI